MTRQLLYLLDKETIICDLTKERDFYTWEYNLMKKFVGKAFPALNSPNVAVKMLSLLE